MQHYSLQRANKSNITCARHLNLQKVLLNIAATIMLYKQPQMSIFIHHRYDPIIIPRSNWRLSISGIILRPKFSHLLHVIILTCSFCRLFWGERHECEPWAECSKASVLRYPEKVLAHHYCCCGLHHYRPFDATHWTLLLLLSMCWRMWRAITTVR